MASPKQYTDGRPAAPRFFAVAGRLLCVDALDAWSAAAAERHFAEWYLTPSAPARADASIRIRRGPPPDIPRGLESFPIGDGGSCFTDGRAYHLDIQGSRVRLGAGGAEVWLGEGVGQASAALARTVFNAFSGAVRRCGLYELHSAAVVGPSGGRAALLAGASGSGKTTLTLQLAAAGWGYLSDDVLLLSEGGGRVEARPLRRDFAATQATAAAVGLTERTGRPTRADSKLRFTPHTFFPGGFVESCSPEALFFPSVTRDAETRVSEVSRPEALLRLLRMCPWACYDRPASAGYLRVLSLVAGQCRAYELRAGTDLLAEPGRAASLLAAYVGR
ncbi:MAG TPA: hypothetical protein VG148_00330 [Pyrinomonadaceae bacterium]|nr:hypothetical protein [Pyrinomonadaceae bacterium]